MYLNDYVYVVQVRIQDNGIVTKFSSLRPSL